MIKKVIRLLDIGKFKEAEAILRPLLEKEPTNTDALFHLALARREQDDIAEAIELLRQAITNQPRNATLYFALGNMQLAIEDYAEAEKNFLKSAGMDPNNVDARNGLAFLDLRRSRFKAAEHSLRIALNIEPQNVQALIFLGTALREQGQHDGAVEHLQMAVTLEPGNVQAQFCLGRALLAAGNSGFATQCFENAVKGEPQSAEFRDWLACAQLNSGNINAARENFYRAIEMGRVNVEVLTGLVKVESLLGNAAAALRVMLQAVQLEPERHDLGLQYANMLLELKLFDAAIEQLQKLQSVAYEPERVALQLATALMKKGESRRALKTLEQLQGDAELAPESRLMLTWALQECGDDEAAAEQLEVLLAQEKPLVDAVLFRARQMYDDGDTQGIDLLRQLLKREDISSSHARQVQLLLAHSLDRSGNYKDAAMEYRGLAQRQCAVHQLATSVTKGEVPAAAMDPAIISDWPLLPPGDGRGQVAFIFAWPGSGRKRLLSALNQHTLLQQLPVEPAQQARRRDRLMEKMGANALAGLSEANIKMGRRNYWRAAGGSGKEPADQQVLDSQWLCAEMLPTIARYFPGTTVLMLTREPRDMALAWMQSGYQELQSMAEVYQLQLVLLDQCRAALPINFITIDYDHLSANSEQDMGLIQTSLGLEPEAAVVMHFDTATTRNPAEPGDWKHYVDELADVFNKFA